MAGLSNSVHENLRKWWDWNGDRRGARRENSTTLMTLPFGIVYEYIEGHQKTLFDKGFLKKED